MTGASGVSGVIRGGFRSLADVRAAFPAGVDPRDAAWMWRRLLVAIGAAHRAGVIHGAVLPEHVLIHPAEHGLVLVDWCYSVSGLAEFDELLERLYGPRRFRPFAMPA